MTHDDRKDRPTAHSTLKARWVQATGSYAFDIVITPREAVVFLVMSACEYAFSPCDHPHCEVCYDFVDTWRSLYATLDAAERGTVEAGLERADVRAPNFPQSLR